MDTIAIIDDDEDTGVLLSYLFKEKWNVVVYHSWDGTMPLLEKDPPNLILLDISLPGSSGEVILKEIRNRNRLKNIAVIALTGHALPEDRSRFLREGFDEYISKPIMDQEQLILLVERVLTEHTRRV